MWQFLTTVVFQAMFWEMAAMPYGFRIDITCYGHNVCILYLP